MDEVITDKEMLDTLQAKLDELARGRKYHRDRNNTAIVEYLNREIQIWDRVISIVRQNAQSPE